MVGDAISDDAIFPDTAFGRALTRALCWAQERPLLRQLIIYWLPFLLFATSWGALFVLRSGELIAGLGGAVVALSWLLAFERDDSRPPGWLFGGSIAILIGAIFADGAVRLDGHVFDLQFASTGQGLQTTINELGGELTTRQFGWDFALIAMYALGGVALAARVWRLDNSALTQRWGFPLLVVLAGAADVAENLFTVHARDVGYNVAAVTIFWLATAKWTFLAVFVVALVYRGFTGQWRSDSSSTPIFQQPPRAWVPEEQLATQRGEGADRKRKSSLTGQTSADPHVGICCSGGGIRSAAFSLGALHGLGHGTVKSAKHLTAVSGGSYIATAMSARYWRHPERYRTKLPFHEGSDELKSLRANSRYLFADGTGGKTTVIRAAIVTVANVAVLWLVLFAVLRPVGWVISSGAVHPELRATGAVVGGVGLDQDVDMDDLTIMRTSTWPTSCEGSESTGAFELAFADGAAPAIRAHVLRDVEDGDIDRAQRVAVELADPGIIEVCGTIATIARQPHIDAPEPYTVNRQFSIEIDDQRPLATRPVSAAADEEPPETSCAVDETTPFDPAATALCDRLDIAEQPRFSHKSGLRGHDDVSLEWWMWAVPIVLLLFAVAATVVGKNITIGKGRPTLRLPVAARITGGPGLLILTTCVLLPFAIQEIPDALHNSFLERVTPDEGPSTGFALWLAVFSAAYAAARTASKHASAVRGGLRRLGLLGVKSAAYLTSALILAGLGFGIVRYAAANGPNGRLAGLGSTFWRPSDVFAAPDLARWFVSIGLLFTLAVVLDVHSWSLHPVYRDRLATAFFPEQDGEAPINLGKRAEQRRESAANPDDWPVLTVCATANLNDAASLRETSAGRYGQSFIFSEDVIGWPDHYVGTREYGDRVRGRNERLLDLDSIVAVSGAAFSPAMGKFGFGPIGGLMAILNLRLGMWVPNPTHVARTTSWRGVPGWPYLLREVFGRYNRKLRHTYVTDGGHWENLGLVELLRRGCNEIYVISAAGDGRYAFATIGEAIALAREVADIDIEVELTPLRPPVGGEDTGDRQLLAQAKREVHRERYALEPYAIGSFYYPRSNQDGKGRGVILYVESAITADVPWDVQAWAEKNVTFPNDSTSDQFFDYGQFEAYRRLGQHQMTIAAQSGAWKSALDWRASVAGAKRPS